MDFNAAGDQTLQQRKKGRQGFTAKEAGAQLFVAGMDRDVQGGEFIRQDPLHLFFTNRRQGDISAVKVGEAIIFVFDIQGGTQAARQLLHKAEQAVIAALRRLRMLDFQPELFVGILVELQFPLFTVNATDIKDEFFGMTGQTHIIEKIAQVLTIDGQKGVARLQIQLFGDTAGGDGLNGDHKGIAP